MYRYLCEVCSMNNNGWCKANKFNGLKKRNIQKCDNFDSIDKKDSQSPILNDITFADLGIDFSEIEKEVSSALTLNDDDLMAMSGILTTVLKVTKSERLIALKNKIDAILELSNK